MTVAAGIDTRVSYIADGTQTDFTIPFAFLDDCLITVDGLSQSFVTTPDNLSFVISPAPASGAEVVIERRTRISQDLSLSKTSPFPAEQVMAALDKQIFIDQELDARLGRIETVIPLSNFSNAILLGNAAGTALTAYDVGDEAARANKALGFDALGNIVPLARDEIPGTIAWSNVTDQPDVITLISGDLDLYAGTELSVVFDGSIWESDGTTGHAASEGNVGTKRVGANGLLYERQFTGLASAWWFGFLPNMTTEASDDAFDLWMDYLDNEAAPGLDRRGELPPGVYNLYRSHQRYNHTGIQGPGQFNAIVQYHGRGPAYYPAGADVDDNPNKKPFFIYDEDYTLLPVWAPTILPITNVVDNGAGKSRITCATHNYIAGDHIWIAGVKGASDVNGLREVIATDGDTYDVDIDFTTAYDEDGQCYKTRDNFIILNITDNGSGQCRIALEQPHGLSDNDWVVLGLLDLLTPDFANGAWQVAVIDATTVDLKESFHDGVTAFGGGVHYLHAGTCATLEVSTQQWHKQRMSYGNGALSFDIGNVVKFGRRQPDTGAIASEIYRGDTTLDAEFNCIYSGGGLFGLIHSGNGDAPGGSNREAFANMHNYYSPYFSNPFGRGSTLVRGVAGTFVGAKYSACGGDGLVCSASYNIWVGSTVFENTKGYAAWFKSGSQDNAIDRFHSGGSNRLSPEVRDDSGLNEFNVITGTHQDRGRRLRSDSDLPGLAGSFKRGAGSGLFYTTADVGAVQMVQANKISGSAVVNFGGAVENLEGFDVPAGYEIAVVQSSVSNRTGGFASGMSIELFELADGVKYTNSTSGVKFGGIDAPLWASSAADSAQGKKYYVRLKNNSVDTQHDMCGWISIVFKRVS